MKERIRHILKEETENKKINSIVDMIWSLFDDVVVDIEVGEILQKPIIRVQIKTEDPAANINSWYDQKIVDTISKYTGDGFKLKPWWSPLTRNEVFNAYIDVYRKSYDDEGNVMNESKDDIQKNIKVINLILSQISWKGLCDKWVEYNPDDGDYEIRFKTTERYFKSDEEISEISYLESTLTSMGLRFYIYVPWFVENCEDEVEFLN